MSKELKTIGAIEEYFRFHIIREEIEEKFAGEPYVRLNHSQWLSHVIHSGGMVEAKETFSFLFFQKKIKKDAIVIFKSSKKLVQGLTGTYDGFYNNGRRYLLDYQTGAKHKTHYTTTLSLFKEWFSMYGKTLPDSIRLSIQIMFKTQATMKISGIIEFMGQHKATVYRMAKLLGIDFAPQDISKIMNWLRQAYFKPREHFKESFIEFLDSNMEGFIEHALPYGIGKRFNEWSKAIDYSYLAADSYKTGAKMIWTAMKVGARDFVDLITGARIKDFSIKGLAIAGADAIVSAGSFFMPEVFAVEKTISVLTDVARDVKNMNLITVQANRIIKTGVNFVPSRYLDTFGNISEKLINTATKGDSWIAKKITPSSPNIDIANDFISSINPIRHRQRKSFEKADKYLKAKNLKKFEVEVDNMKNLSLYNDKIHKAAKSMADSKLDLLKKDDALISKWRKAEMKPYKKERKKLYKKANKQIKNKKRGL